MSRRLQMLFDYFAAQPPKETITVKIKMLRDIIRGRGGGGGLTKYLRDNLNSLVVRKGNALEIRHQMYLQRMCSCGKNA